MKKITDKDVEALKAGKKVTKGFIHMQLDDKGKLNLWSDINITDNYRSLKIDANKLFDHGILSEEYDKLRVINIGQHGIYESGEKYDSTRFDRRIDACQG